MLAASLAAENRRSFCTLTTAAVEFSRRGKINSPAPGKNRVNNKVIIGEDLLFMGKNSVRGDDRDAKADKIGKELHKTKN